MTEKIFDEDIYETAKSIIIDNGRASISLLQRKLIIGYGRAFRLMEALEKRGVVSAPDENGARAILKT